MMNTRSETVSEKPSFRGLIKHKKCLVVSDGYYEWRKDPEGKEVRSFTILTTSPNPLLKAVHGRMPVILRKGLIDPWLDPKIDLREIDRRVRSFPG